MKVKFEKDHLEHKADEVKDIEDARANYFIRTKVVTEQVEDPEGENDEEEEDNEKVEVDPAKPKRGRKAKEKKETGHTPKAKTTGIAKG